MSTLIIHKQNGQTFEIPEENLANTRRLLGAEIVHVERKGESENLVESISEELVVEITGKNDEGNVETVTEKIQTNKPTLKELETTDKDVLRSIADKLSEEKTIAKANHRAGVKKLAEYIFDNQ